MDLASIAQQHILAGLSKKIVNPDQKLDVTEVIKAVKQEDVRGVINQGVKEEEALDLKGKEIKEKF